jgi:MEMO1 family protein
MAVRACAVAGQFYEGSAEACREHIREMLASIRIDQPLPERIVAGIVPHAGWVFSGSPACRVFEAIRRQGGADTFVIFGAVHSVMAQQGLLYETGAWKTPLGDTAIDEELARRILDAAGGVIQADEGAHRREHSIEVQVPIIRYLFPEAKIVPILAPPVAGAHRIGEAVAGAIADAKHKVVCIGSTDLTHYGPSYGFTPMGTGARGISWAKEENDRFFIDLALKMQADKLVETSQMYGSACGGGAAAATVAAAKILGAEKGYLLAHTTSAEVVQDRFGRPSDDSVGYAAIVFG